MHNKKDREKVTCVAEQIEEYLSEHPNAADSLEGIVKWWLTRQHYENRYEIVNKALDVLVEKGIISKSKVAGQTIYIKKGSTKKLH